ncbi:MAG: monooxygenase component MmoB/DmpM [Frankiales bacterium]|jgi:phenol hydroxylase P2 protein|nr:monooxygenase component MmoB/DmpM [Frankiales bacterium]
MTTGTPVKSVGVELQESSDDARMVIEAIQRDNADVVVSYLPGLVKVQSPGELVIRRETVEELLGRPWETHEFQLVIVSYYGHIGEWDDDQIVIKWDH